MKRKKQILRRVLFVLIAVFLILGIGALFLAGRKQKNQDAEKKRENLEALRQIPTVTPTPAATATPTPTPTPLPTPTAVPTVTPAFNPDDYWDNWYSTDGLACINIYDISNKSVSFYFTQSNGNGTRVSEADVTAEVAGNAAQLSFTDSWGNYVRGTLIFDNGSLYVRLKTDEQTESAALAPSVDCIMVREKAETYYQPEETPTPAAAPVQTGDYYFADSNSRYLTDEELSAYSSADLELAKNEIYARHGRQFVTQYIADYFNSKSWYQGTIDPETFDSQQDSIFNEYEIANISKIVEWEEKKRSEGN